MEGYKMLGRAGEGAHGCVYKAINLKNQQRVALKKIPFNPSAGIPKTIMREICSLRVLKSQYVVKLLDVSSMGSAVVLVMEFLPCSLGDILKNVDINTGQIKSYMEMILKGVSFLHKHSIMHRDLKPANLLISSEGILKIADFGLSRILSDEKGRQYSHQVATRWYRAPELLYGSKTYTTSVDMWAVGCIFGEMINKKPLFAGETDIEQLAIVLATLGSPTEETWPDLTSLPDYNKIAFTPSSGKTWDDILVAEFATPGTKDLIGKLLIYDGARRLCANEALDSVYFVEDPPGANLENMPKPYDFSNKWNSDGQEDSNSDESTLRLMSPDDLKENQFEDF